MLIATVVPQIGNVICLTQEEEVNSEALVTWQYFI